MSSSSSPPADTTATATSSKNNNQLRQLLQYWYIECAIRPYYDNVFIGLLLVLEFLLGIIIIIKIPYTEIDWIAYMQEVNGYYVEGHTDYLLLRGDTGPLVYPAGFLYLFRFLQYWTNDGQIQSAQWIFLGFYLLTQFVVLKLYTHVIRYDIRRPTSSSDNNNNIKKIDDENPQQQQQPQQQQHLLQLSHQIWSFRIFAMGCLCLSKRFHSIFLLRLFNDGPTMLFTYISFWLFVRQKWNMGCFVYSIAVSLKMNVLLFAPGLLYLLLENNLQYTIPRLAICAVTQLILGAPFLTTYPISYLRKAFELDRQFFYKWTVNFKFLSEDVFLSKSWAAFLLLLHVGLLLVFHYRLYHHQNTSHVTTTTNNNNKNDNDDDKLNKNKTTTSSTTTDDSQVPKPSSSSPQHILMTLFVSNFIGICCARTLHYQFYSWYFSSLPILLWRSSTLVRYSIPIRFLLLGMIEYAFLTFPATPFSSLCLQVAHWLILIPWIIYPMGTTIQQQSKSEVVVDSSLSNNSDESSFVRSGKKRN